ncbi:extensin-like [Punica granatum]|uniref:Extensin-like n=1 Tax=Punica granatum TaxID=22663 RepID=A0A6P8DE35_PUNGR|nr:extensin-like [Punica granatum]
MAEENQLGVFEEDTPLTPIHSQAPTMHAPPPHVSPAGVPPAHQGASPTHFSPPASSGAHPAYSEGQPSSATDDRARIVVLESTVNQLAATMATNMTELMALLKSPNRASSSFTPPPGYGPAVDPNPWAQPTLILDNGDTSAPTIVNAPAAHPVNNLPASLSFSHPANLPTVTHVPSATMSEPPILVPPPISTLVPVPVSASVPAPTSAVPPPIIFLPITAQASAHTAEPPPYQAP